MNTSKRSEACSLNMVTLPMLIRFKEHLWNALIQSKEKSKKEGIFKHKVFHTIRKEE